MSLEEKLTRRLLHAGCCLMKNRERLRTENGQGEKQENPDARGLVPSLVDGEVELRAAAMITAPGRMGEFLFWRESNEKHAETLRLPVPCRRVGFQRSEE